MPSVIDTLLGIAALVAFIGAMVYRFRTILERFKLQGIGLVKSKNLLLESLINIVFWMIPLNKYKDISDLKHNKYVVMSNYLLLVFIIIITVYIII